MYPLISLDYDISQLHWGSRKVWHYHLTNFNHTIIIHVSYKSMPFIVTYHTQPIISSSVSTRATTIARTSEREKALHEWRSYEAKLRLGGDCLPITCTISLDEDSACCEIGLPLGIMNHGVLSIVPIACKDPANERQT